MHKIDTPRRGPSHLDIVAPRAEAHARVEAALAAGGTLADDSHAPKWWTLADADGHKIDITPSRT
jgi:4a-hydroxytetrahydrobiopterin dehydratase